MSTVTELRAAIDKAISEDWDLVKNTAGAVNTAAEIFPLAYRFGWHAARKYEGYVEADERIRQLEELNKILAAEVDRQRLVIERVHDWLLSKGAPARAIALSEAYDTYELSKPK